MSWWRQVGGVRVDLLPLREFYCNGCVEEKLRCVPSASWSDRGSGVFAATHVGANLAFARVCQNEWISMSVA